MRSTFTRILFMLSFVAIVAACESSEERAEKYFQSGVALLDEGEVDRGLVELRNVFDLDPTHLEARRLYARTMLDLGRQREAYGQYLRLVEQSADDVEGRRALAELAVTFQDWEEAERHLTRAKELAPDDVRVQAVDVVMRYRQAVTDEDRGARQAAVQEAIVLIDMVPDQSALLSMQIDNALRDQEFGTALGLLDEAIAQNPANLTLYRTRLTVLAQLADYDEIAAQLREMVTVFPDNAEIKSALVRFYMSQGQPENAESFMREIADPTDEDLGLFVSLVQFIAQTKGNEAALEELDGALEVSSNPDLINSIKSGLLFNMGRREESTALMEEVLTDAEPGPQTDNIKVALAKQLVVTGNEVGARRLVEEVLTSDPTQGAALKMRAAWLIEADQPDEAIAALRTALDQEPEDSEAMTIMALAHSRNGNHELSRDMLSLAVEASNSAPDESIRYAEALMVQEAYSTAEDTLLASLRLNTRNINLLETLGRLYIITEDYPRARQVEDTARRIGTPAGVRLADTMRVEIVSRESGADATANLLESLAEGESNTALAAGLELVRVRLAAGENDAAVEAVEQLVAENPGNLSLQYARAATYAGVGDFDTSIAGYRALLQTNPGAARIWLELSRVLAASGAREAGQQAIRDGLAQAPEDLNLMWAYASDLEREGDIDGAIETYEKMYGIRSNSNVIANNLASLLVTWRDDTESVERAYTIARRLRGTEVPAFQDTYGWILYRRGDHDEAQEYLEDAAAGLGEDPIVQYHLAMNYLALGRDEDALEQFVTAVEVAGPADSRPQIETARSEIQRIQAQLAAEAAQEQTDSQ